MQGGIDDLYFALWWKRYRADSFIIGLVGLSANDFDESLLSGFFIGQIFDFLYVLGDLIHQVLIVRWYQLTAILIVYLFAVVGRQIVAGTEHIAGNGIQMADGKRQLGRAARLIIHIDFDLVGCIHLGGGDGELAAVQIHDGIGGRIIVDAFLNIFSDIIGQHNPPLFGFFAEHVDQVLRMALGGGLNGPGIDAVGTDADQAPAAAGAKRNDLVKCIQQKIPALVVD